MFIAREVERPLGELPGRVTVSVVTIGELELGVLSASGSAARARRGDTLSLARTAEPVPISESVVTQDDDCDQMAGAHEASTS